MFLTISCHQVIVIQNNCQIPIRNLNQLQQTILVYWLDFLKLQYILLLIIMAHQTKTQKHQFSQYAPYQIFSGVFTGFCVSPVNTIVDKSVIQYTNGKTKLWNGVSQGFKKLFLQPVNFLKAFQFKWIFAVYAATYSTSNLADHVHVNWMDPAIVKLLMTFTVNTTLSLLKDKALAQRLGNGEVRKFPASALSLFFLRDIIAIASAFTIPPIFGKFLEKKFDLSQSFALKLAQLSSPVLIQLIGTPVHLLGLDLYNKPDISVQQRLTCLKAIYWNSVILRMLRFLPAYGIGGVVNTQLRNRLKPQNH